MKEKIIYIILIIILFTANITFANISKINKLTEFPDKHFNGIKIDSYFSEGLFSEKIVAVNADSTLGRIESIWFKGNQYYVKLNLANYDEEIKLSVYNMLGKEVLLIHQNKALPRDSEYTFDGSLLPNGIYICILEGKNYRDAEKFVVSR